MIRGVKLIKGGSVGFEILEDIVDSLSINKDKYSTNKRVKTLYNRPLDLVTRGYLSDLMEDNVIGWKYSLPVSLSVNNEMMEFVYDGLYTKDHIVRFRVRKPYYLHKDKVDLIFEGANKCRNDKTLEISTQSLIDFSGDYEALLDDSVIMDKVLNALSKKGMAVLEEEDD